MDIAHLHYCKSDGILISDGILNMLKYNLPAYKKTDDI